MNIKNLLCMVSVAALASATSVQAQSLTDAAKMEKQRRAKIRTPTKVYTEGDRNGTTPPPASGDATASATATAAPAAGKKGAKEKTADELQAEKIAEWNERVKKVQDEIAALQATISQNETTLASTYNITPARAAMATKIEADKKHVVELQQQLVSLEDERRRAGLPRR